MESCLQNLAIALPGFYFDSHGLKKCFVSHCEEQYFAIVVPPFQCRHEKPFVTKFFSRDSSFCTFPLISNAGGGLRILLQVSLVRRCTCCMLTYYFSAFVRAYNVRTYDATAAVSLPQREMQCSVSTGL